MIDPLIVAIAGGSGSGKSLFAKRIFERLTSQNEEGRSASILCEDRYYFDLRHLPHTERAKQNFDHPDALEHTLLLSHIERLKRGESVEVPCYDYGQHIRAESVEKLEATTVLIVEGILLLHDESLRDRFDLKLFMDVEIDVCFQRRLERDLRDRDRTEASIRDQFEKTVKPMYEKFVLPSKIYADEVITGGGENLEALDLMMEQIESLLLAKKRLKS